MTDSNTRQIPDFSKAFSGKPPKLMFVAGEASGDDHAARVIRHILSMCPQAQLFGMGGHMMREAGMRLDEDLAGTLNIMGFVQVILRLPDVFRMMGRAVELLKVERPDALVLVDYPGFNLRLAKRAAKLGIPVIYYISPQLWAWNYRRIETIRSCIGKMLVIFPFERDMYEAENIPVEFVGHPLMDEYDPGETNRETVRSRLLDKNAPEDTLLVGLIPGSRRKEVQRLMPPLLESARRIMNEIPNVRFVLPRARTVSQDLLEQYLSQAKDLPIILTETDPRSVYSALDFAVCKSGTSTLEMGLAGTPMIIVYKVSRINEWIVRLVIRVRWVGLVNIVANEELAPELLGSGCTVDTITTSALRFLKSPKLLEDTRQKLRLMCEKIGGPGCAENTAGAILKFVADQNR